MTRARLHFFISITLVLIASSEGRAQGPPIHTDTPIMLGLQGRGVRTFVKFIRKASLRHDGKHITDDKDRRVTVRVTPLALPFNLFSDRFQIGAILPLLDVSLKSRLQNQSSSGIGDLKLFAKYLFVQVDRKNETFRVASKVGIKLPTGDDQRTPALGTGSTDYFLASVAGWIKGRFGIYGEGIYNLNTANDQINFGNSFSYNLALGYRVLPAVYETYPSPQLNGFLELNGTIVQKNRASGQKIIDSGGTILFLSPGFQYIGGRRWLIEATVQYPIINRPNGTQLATDWTFSLGTRILLF